MKALKDDKLEIDVLKSMTYTEINELMISLHFENHRLTEQLRLHGVVKPFYCLDTPLGGVKRCSLQCDNCRHRESKMQ